MQQMLKEAKPSRLEDLIALNALYRPGPMDYIPNFINRKHKLEKRVILQSFDFRTLHEMKKLAPEIQLSALYSGKPKSFVER